MRTIHVETDLPTDADRMWSALQHPSSFLYVTRGLFGMPALAGRTDPIRAGEVGSGWLLAFHVLPLHRHTIEVREVDTGTRTIRTHEHGGLLRRWDHTLHVDPLAGGAAAADGGDGAGGAGSTDPADPADRSDRAGRAGGVRGPSCRYGDTVTIDAGRLTPLVALLAVGIYRYRQRRWHRLVRKHLLPAGAGYAVAR